MLRKQLQCSKKVQSNGSKGLKVKGTHKEVDKHEQHLNMFRQTQAWLFPGTRTSTFGSAYLKRTIGVLVTCEVTKHKTRKLAKSHITTQH